jgi:hypothetical protein
MVSSAPVHWKLEKLPAKHQSSRRVATIAHNLRQHLLLTGEMLGSSPSQLIALGLQPLLKNSFASLKLILGDEKKGTFMLFSSLTVTTNGTKLTIIRDCHT